MKALVLSGLLLLGMNSFGHEGAHGPQQKMAPHGGVLKDGKALMGELVQDSSGVRIHFLSHKSKAIDPKSLKLDSKMILLTDAKKKSVQFELVTEANAILLRFDKAKSYRYNLVLPVEHSNVQDKLTWQFESHSN